MVVLLLFWEAMQKWHAKVMSEWILSHERRAWAAKVFSGFNSRRLWRFSRGSWGAACRGSLKIRACTHNIVRMITCIVGCIKQSSSRTSLKVWGFSINAVIKSSAIVIANHIPTRRRAGASTGRIRGLCVCRSCLVCRRSCGFWLRSSRGLSMKARQCSKVS